MTSPRIRIRNALLVAFAFCAEWWLPMALVLVIVMGLISLTCIQQTEN
jgi:hypothetical protein